MLRQMRTLYAQSNRAIRIFYNCSATVLIELGEAFVDHFTVVVYGLNTISPLFLRFVLRIIIFIVRFCMFQLAVVCLNVHCRLVVHILSHERYKIIYILS